MAPSNKEFSSLACWSFYGQRDCTRYGTPSVTWEADIAGQAASATETWLPPTEWSIDTGGVQMPLVLRNNPGLNEAI